MQLFYRYFAPAITAQTDREETLTPHSRSRRLIAFGRLTLAVAVAQRELIDRSPVRAGIGTRETCAQRWSAVEPDGLATASSGRLEKAVRAQVLGHARLARPRQRGCLS